MIRAVFSFFHSLLAAFRLAVKTALFSFLAALYVGFALLEKPIEQTLVVSAAVSLLFGAAAAAAWLSTVLKEHLRSRQVRVTRGRNLPWATDLTGRAASPPPVTQPRRLR